MRKSFDKVSRKFAQKVLGQTDQRRLHPKRNLLELALLEAAQYAKDHMNDALILDRREKILDLAVARMTDLETVLEFEVAEGEPIQHLAATASRTIHDFDSFEDLPEDWLGRHKARRHYSINVKQPQTPHNATLHKGWFKDTLPAYLRFDDDPVALLHIDCDLYSSLKTVLCLLGSCIQSRTTIVFDEYFNFIGWHYNEFRAFRNFLAKSALRYRYLTWLFQQAVVVFQGEAK